MRRSIGVLGVAIVAALACSEGSEITDPSVNRARNLPDGAALFANACGGCHSLEGPVFASVTKPDEAWALLRQMDDHGLCLTDVEKAAIVKYMCSRQFQNSH